MSTTTTLPQAVKALPWDLWIRQVRGIVALEAGRNLLRRRSLFLYILALAPPLLLSLRFVVPTPENAIESIGGLSVLFAVIYRNFFLRLAVFFGCVGLFTRLFRGDVLERTIHYYLLAPVRREVLVVGKYLSGVCTAGLIFGLSTAASFLLMFAPSGAANWNSCSFGGRAWRIWRLTSASPCWPAWATVPSSCWWGCSSATRSFPRRRSWAGNTSTSYCLPY